MIKIQEIVKRYGTKIVLNINNLSIPTGENFGLVGNNGAGKTTLFNLILDLIAPTNGMIFNKDFQVDKNETWKKYTAAYLDESFLIDYLSPEEYFQFLGTLRGESSDQVNDFIASFSDFFNDEVLNQNKYIRDLSKGNQKKVGIVGTFVGNPKLILLDEPFANLDPSSQMQLKKIFHNINAKKNNTLLISSHDLIHVTDVCNRIVVLNKGAVVKDLYTSNSTLKELESYFLNTA